MGSDRRRLEATLLVVTLLVAGAGAPLPAERDAGCLCGAPCLKCCCTSADPTAQPKVAAENPGEGELCVMRRRDGTAPPPEAPAPAELRLRQAVFNLPRPVPSPGLVACLAAASFRLPDSLVLSPDVPPPRAAV